jgi:hypothetical protein
MQEHSTTPEEWRPVVGYEGVYEVSSLGRVRSLNRHADHPRGPLNIRGMQISPFKNARGYLRVSLRDSGARSKRTVHSLVLEAFIGPRPGGMQSRHLNGNKADNRPENLTWGTAKQNIADKRAHGTQPLGSECVSAKLDERDVIEIRRRNAGGEAAASIVMDFPVALSTVCRVINRDTWAWMPPGELTEETC